MAMFTIIIHPYYMSVHVKETLTYTTHVSFLQYQPIYIKFSFRQRPSVHWTFLVVSISFVGVRPSAIFAISVQNVHS